MYLHTTNDLPVTTNSQVYHFQQPDAPSSTFVSEISQRLAHLPRFYLSSSRIALPYLSYLRNVGNVVCPNQAAISHIFKQSWSGTWNFLRCPRIILFCKSNGIEDQKANRRDGQERERENTWLRAWSWGARGGDARFVWAWFKILNFTVRSALEIPYLPTRASKQRRDH